MRKSKEAEKNPTRDQVAQKAGVSSATVSRVYNNPGSVSTEKRSAVFDAAEELGYIPNKAASALRRNGTGIITLLELKKEKREYYWADLSLFKWFYADVLTAVKEVVDKSMYQLNLATAGSASDIDKLRGLSDGLICYDVDRPAEAEMIAAASIPYVIGHHTKDYEGHPRCSTDNTEGGAIQAKLLKKAGCRKPAYITAHTVNVKPNRDRLNGFLAEFGEANVRVIESRVGREAGYRATESLLPELKNGEIDGIAAVNDITAVGAGYAISDAGLRAQQDIPLAGYDNMPLRAVLPFELLTVALKPAEIYRNAAEMLLAELAGIGQAPFSRIISPEPISYPY